MKEACVGDLDTGERRSCIEGPYSGRCCFEVPFGIGWPGFVLNTLFYAPLLWLLLLVAPRYVRRLLRARRGLCRTCGYPVGEAAVCSECGRAVGIQRCQPAT